MNIVIVGPGALGCLFAARLAEGGCGVSMLDYRPDRARGLSRDGIRVDDACGTRPVRMRVEADAAALAAPDFLCFCVKAYDTAAAARHARGLIGPSTAAVSLQNGLGNAEELARAAPPALLCAATSQGATSLGPGHVAHAGSGPTLVAPFDAPSAGAAARFADALNRAGLESRPHPDAAAVLWSKLAVNAAINPVTALWNVPNGAVAETPELLETARDAAAEVERVARANGVSLIWGDAAAEVEKVCRNTRDNLSSMLQDVRRGRRTEIDAINGALVREADRLGIEVPVNRMLLERVRAAERR